MEFAVSTILTIPQTVASVVQLCKCIKPAHEDGDEQARRSMLESLERRYRDGKEKVDAADIPQRQKDQLLYQFSRLKKMIDELGRNGQMQNMKAIEMVCDLVEDALHQVLAHAAAISACTRPQAHGDELADIKGKMLQGRPFNAAKYPHIYHNSDELPDDVRVIGLHGLPDDMRPFAMLADQLCFIEYFPLIGADSQKTKSRIGWMMLLLTQLKCPRLLQPLKVFPVSGIARSGFYTFSRVPSDQQGGAGPLHTLAECMCNVRNKKRALLQLSEAVEEIHAQTILHKNICAYNVILDEADNAWLAGFSSSRLDDQGSYKIPEEDKRRMKMVYYDTDDPSHHLRTFKCDIYALGVTMLEVLVGTSFVQNTELIKSRAHIIRLLYQNCNTGQLNKLICDCLNPEARCRPQAAEIRSTLEFMDPQNIDDFFHPAAL